MCVGRLRCGAGTFLTVCREPVAPPSPLFRSLACSANVQYHTQLLCTVRPCIRAHGTRAELRQCIGRLVYGVRSCTASTSVPYAHGEAPWRDGPRPTLLFFRLQVVRRSLITYIYLLTAHGASVLMEVEEAGGGGWRQAEAAGGGSCAKPPPGAAVASTRVPLDPTELDRIYTSNTIVTT